MESAFSQRRVEDLRRLRELEVLTAGKIRVVRTSGRPLDFLELDLHYRTAPSPRYPEEVADVTRLEIRLSNRYPFQEPAAAIRTAVFHPNVYTSGRICLGAKWLPTEGLDLFVRRIARIVTFDPEVTNTSSPANGEAARWYQSALRRRPDAFPTDRVELSIAAAQRPKVRWSDVPVDTGQAKLVFACHSCGTGLRVLAGVKALVRCPRCGATFGVSG